MAPTPRKPSFTAEKKENTVTPVETTDDAVETDGGEVRGGQNLHTRLERLESRVLELEDAQHTDDPDGERAAFRGTGIDQESYEREYDDKGNVTKVVNPEDNNLAISTDASGNVVRDPNQR
jgi:hypothetical protein